VRSERLSGACGAAAPTSAARTNATRAGTQEMLLPRQFLRQIAFLERRQ